MIWHTYAYIELFALNTVHRCVVFLISQGNGISHQKTKKKDFDTQQVLCFI